MTLAEQTYEVTKQTIIKDNEAKQKQKDFESLPVSKQFYTEFLETINKRALESINPFIIVIFNPDDKQEDIDECLDLFRQDGFTIKNEYVHRSEPVSRGYRICWEPVELEI